MSPHLIQADIAALVFGDGLHNTGAFDEDDGTTFDETAFFAGTAAPQASSGSGGGGAPAGAEKSAAEKQKVLSDILRRNAGAKQRDEVGSLPGWLVDVGRRPHLLWLAPCA